MTRYPDHLIECMWLSAHVKLGDLLWQATSSMTQQFTKSDSILVDWGAGSLRHVPQNYLVRKVQKYLTFSEADKARGKAQIPYIFNNKNDIKIFAKW